MTPNRGLKGERSKSNVNRRRGAMMKSVRFKKKITIRQFFVFDYTTEFVKLAWGFSFKLYITSTRELQ